MLNETQPTRTMVTDKLKSYAAAKRKIGLKVEHRKHKGLNNRAENSDQLTRVREKVKRRFKSTCQLQRFLTVHYQVVKQFMHCRYNRDAKQKRELRTQASTAWNEVACAKMAPM